MKKSFNVDSTFNDMRLDRWIRNNLGKIPQGLIEKNLRNGKIKLNNKKTKSSKKVKTNDKIDLFNLIFPILKLLSIKLCGIFPSLYLNHLSKRILLHVESTIKLLFMFFKSNIKL